MSRLSPPQTAPVIRFEYLNWLAADPLPRDQAQSHRLHEPERLVTSIDPTYEAMPFNHPNLRLPFPSTDDDDRGG
jgi:hypothetical protein